MKSLIRRILGKFLRLHSHPDTPPTAADPEDQRSVELENLEPRMLFSAAPADAPDQPAPEPQAAEEAVVVVTQAAANQAVVSLAGSEIEGEDPDGIIAAEQSIKQAEADAAAVEAGASNIPGDVEINLVDVNEQAAELNAQALSQIGAAPDGQSDLSQETLDEIADAAAQRWIDSGLDAAQTTALSNLRYEVADLSALHAATFIEGTVYVDYNANTRSWFIDGSPLDDSEYSLVGSTLTATSGSAAGEVDLLTILLQEQGHALGLEDVYGAENSANAMYGTAETGVRRLPVAGQAEGAVAGSILGPNHASFAPNVFTDAALNAGNNATEFTLREAILAANAAAGADVIDLTALGAGTFTLTINGTDDNSGDLDIRNGDLTIMGLGSGMTFIDGGGSGGTLQDRVVEIHGGSAANPGAITVTFDDLTIQNGFLQSSHGGGIRNNYGDVILTDAAIDGNVVQSTGAGDRHGGGIWNRGGSITGTNVDITDNRAERNGGGNNDVGGGLWNNEDSTVNLTNVEFSGNEAREGAGFYNSDDLSGSGVTVTLTTATIDGNTAIVRGGGFYNASRRATVTINGGTISKNTADEEHGGGFYNNGAVILDAVDITDNQALDTNNTNGRPDDSYGGGFFNNAAGSHPTAGRVTITGGSITGNQANGHGGGFWNRNGFVTIEGTSADPVEINSNRAGFVGTPSDTRSGGGFYNSDAAETKLTWVDFYDGVGTQNKVYSVGGTDADNDLRGVGAGFYNSSQSTVYLDNVSITNHRADSGGAFYQDGIQSQIIGTNVTLDDNFARTRGGAFRNATTGGLVDLTDSSIDGNIALNENGGGFYNNGTVNLDNTDVENGQALDLDNVNRRDSHGGGFYNGGGIVNLTNGSDVLNNVGYGDGAGFRNASGIVNMTDGVVDGNKIIMHSTATQHGGGFWNSGDAITNLDSVIISNNDTGADTPLGGTGDPPVSDGTRTRGVGGGFWNTDGSIVNIKGDSQIIGNRAEGGGGFYNTSTGSVVNIIGTAANPIEIGTQANPNTARNQGGGFQATGNTTVNLSYVDITYNTVDDQRGGGVYADGTALTGDHVKVNNNHAGTVLDNGNEQGGGLWLSGNGKTVLTDSEINNNRTESNGGGLYITGNDVELINTSVEGNFSENSGGGFYANGSSVVTLTDTSVSDNIARDHGGGIFISDDAKASVTRSNVDGNLAGYEDDGVTRRESGTGGVGGVAVGDTLYGGGLWNSGRAQVTFNDSTLNDNEASRRGGGARLENEAVLTLNGSTVSGNVGDDHGGAISIATNSQVYANNSTISGNYAGFSRAENGGSLVASRDGSVGGGLWTQSGGNVVHLNHVTVSDNKATSTAGAGLYRSSGAITVENSIVFGNLGNFETGSPNNSDTGGNSSISVNLVGANVIGTNTSGTLQGNVGGLLTTDPGLGVLADNGNPIVLPDGGTPQTHAITGASSAAGQAIASTVAVDQRGSGRPATGDLGAYEADPIATTLTIDDLTIPENAISGTAFDVEAVATSTGAGPLTYAWTIDGTPSGAGAAMDSLTATNPSTDPVQTVDVTVTVTDTTTGQSASETRQVTVVDPMAMPTTGTGSAIVTIATDEDDGDVSLGDISLREAVKLANASGSGTFVITFAAGINPTLTIAAVADENGNANGDLDITKTNGAVSIVGNTGPNTTIDGGGVDRVFDVRPGTTAYFTNLTITGGATTTIDHGAGLRILGANAVFKDVDITGNEAIATVDNVGGGIYMTSSGVNSSRVYMTRGSVSNNKSDSHGGGIYMSGTNVGESLLHLTDTVISGNSASDPLGTRTDRDGGGLYITDDGNRVVLNNVTVSDNIANGTSSSDGGGALFTGADHIIEINGGSWIRNQAGRDALTPTAAGDNDGGGFMVEGTRQTITLTSVDLGGELSGGADVNGLGTNRVNGNLAEDEGGAFYMQGRFNTVNLIDTQIIGNEAHDDGGGFMIINDTETVNISQTGTDLGVIRNNLSTTSNGAGFRSDGIVNITGTAAIPFEIRYNEARGSVGGGFYTTSNGTTTLTDVVVRNNQALNNGGGYYNSGGGHVVITSSTASTSGTPGSFVSKIIDNKVTNGTSGDGGGFYQTTSYSTSDLTDVLISGNTSVDEGGGFYVSSNFGQVNLTRVDLTGNESQDNGGGFMNASNGSIVEMDTVLIDGNRSTTEHGGGFFNAGQVTGQTVTITNNKTGYDLANVSKSTSDLVGGAFYNSAGRLDLVDAVIEDNYSLGRGGGFYNASGGLVEISSKLIRSSISNNTVDSNRNEGGGFWNGSAGSIVRLNGVDVKNNTSGVEGGGFYQESDGARVELTDVILDKNVTGNHGGAFYNASGFSEVVLDDVEITNNKTTNSHGGGFRNNGQVVGKNVLIDGNSTVGTGNSNRLGGGFWNNGSTALVELDDVKITNNDAYGRGGGFYNSGTGQVRLTNFLVGGNTTDQNTSESQGRGAGFWNSGNADVFLTDGKVDGNKSFGYSAGFHQQDTGSSVTATNVTISNNVAGVDPVTAATFSRGAGGFYNASSTSTVSLTDVLITGNVATIHGGGFYNSGTVTGERVRITDNKTVDLAGGNADRVGGGFFNTGGSATVTLTDFDISGNVANSRGAGVFNNGNGDVFLTNGTISNNIAGDRGGGVYQESTGSTATLTNVTVSGNQSGRNGDGTVKQTNEHGGGIYNTSASFMTLNHVTVANNSATGSGGGIRRDGGTVTLTNSIVADNKQDSDNTNVDNDVSGTITGTEVNLVENGTVSGAGTTLTTDPGLQPLADNGNLALPGGGAALTHALLVSPASAAIDASTGSTVTEDQRGLGRSTPNDLGAFETGLQINGTTGADHFLVRKDAGGNIELHLTTGPGFGSTIVSTVFDLSQASMASLTVDGLDGNDTLTVDYGFDGSFFNLPITFNGDNPALPTTPGDALFIDRGAFTTVTHDMTGPSAGNFDIDGFIDLISYTGLESSVDMTGSTATDFIFNLPTGADNARLRDIDGTPGGNLSLLSTDSPVTFQQTDFVAPTGSLTITGAADDSLELFNGITMGADLIVNVGTTTVTGDLDVSAGATPLIDINSDDVIINTATGMLDAGAGRVEIAPLTAGTLIHFGNTTPAGELNLSDGEVDRITAGVLQVGDATAGRILFSGTGDGGLITPLNVDTVHLITFDHVTDGPNNNTGGGIRVANLAIEAMGDGTATLDSDRAVRLTNTRNQVASDVDTLAATSSQGWIDFRDDETSANPTPGVGLTIGTVDGVSGVINTTPNTTNSRERVTITVNNGDLVIPDLGLANEIQSGREVILQVFGNQNQIQVQTDATIAQTLAATMTLRADNIDLDGVIAASGRTVVLRSDDNGNEIHIGTGAADVLNDDILEISQLELDQITAGTVQIGHHNYGSTAGAGAITVVGTTTLPNSNNLRFRTNSTVSQGAAGSGNIITETNFGINARGDVSLDEANVINGNVAIDLRTGAAATSGNITFRNEPTDGGWVIQQTTGVDNIFATDNGDILINSTKTVTVDEDSDTGTGVVDPTVELRATTLGIGSGNITINIGDGTTDGRDFITNNAVDNGTTTNLDQVDIITAGDLNINLLGTGNAQIVFNDSTNIDVGGNINFNVNGAGNNNSGVHIHGGTTIDVAGELNLTIQGNNGQLFTNFDDGNPVEITATGGTLTIDTDRFIVDPNSVITIDGQDLFISPFSDGDNIILGVTGDATDGNMRISNAELGTIAGDAGSTLNFGATGSGNDTGDVTVAGDIDLTVNTVFDETAGSTILNDGVTITSAQGDQTYRNNPLEVGDAGGAGTTGIANIVTGAANGLVFESTTLFNVDLLNTTPGTGHDQLNVTGMVTLNDADLDLNPLAGFLSPTAGDEFVLISNDGADAVVGTFAGLAEGTIISLTVMGAPSELFQISYQGGTLNNDVVLTALGVQATTDVMVDGSGNLIIKDIDEAIPGGGTTGNSADNWNIRVEGSEVVVTSGGALGTLISGATQTSVDEVRVDVGLFSGDVIVNGLALDDSITIGDLGDMILPMGIMVDGGDGFDNIFYTGAGSVLTAGSNASFTGEEIDFYLGSDLSTTDGDITATAAGGSGANYQGIHVFDADLSAGGTGAITLSGSGGDTGNSNIGVFLTHGSTLTTNDGNIDIDGTGGGTGVGEKGVMIFAETSLSAGGSGNLTIDGTGSVGGSLQNEGVEIISGTSASVVNGNMTITGTGGGTGGLGFGVSVAGTMLTGTGTGNITINGTSAATGGFNNVGVQIWGTDIDTMAGSGSVTVSGSGSPEGTDNNMGVRLSTANIETGTDASIDIDGTGAGSGANNIGVQLTSDANLTVSGSGTISIDGTGSAAGTVNSYGVELAPDSDLTVANGDLTISGTGGGSALGGINSKGVLASGAILTGSGTGNLSITGTASGVGSNNQGIELANTTLTTAAAGTGSITLTGTGSAAGLSGNQGVRLAGTHLATGTGGNIDIDGTAGGDASGFHNTGVELVTASTLTAGGAGAIDIDGTAGSGQMFGRGIYVTGAGSAITSGSGTITMEGTGAGSLYFNRGIELNYVDVSTTGNLIITGNGGASDSFNEGVYVLGGSFSGALNLTGIAAPTSSGIYNIGVYLLSANFGGATGSITGAGGGGTGFNHGIYAVPPVAGLALTGSTTDGNATSLPVAP